MRRLNVKDRVVIGLVGLTVSLIMLAFLLGIVPDRESAVRDGRTVLAEAIAVHSTSAVLTTGIQRLETDFKLMADRNPDLLSLALRRKDGGALVATADHADNWQDMSDEYSKDTQVLVPIWAGEHKWGQLELRFKALNDGGLKGMIQNPILRIMLVHGGILLHRFLLLSRQGAPATGSVSGDSGKGAVGTRHLSRRPVGARSQGADRAGQQIFCSDDRQGSGRSTRVPVRRSALDGR